MVKSFSIAKKPRVLFGVGLTTEAPKELKKAGCKNIFDVFIISQIFH